ncbi:tetratricopeptide repeat protein [Beggiatoa leptomitoformis]|uniref:Tetratricopeptide repeat protein n=1 Tax=Beggiatoa leptomitoformis TaxID=288004 RepID=A0A2N9YF66_9GAMM|nr:tetratricopeptide repeat protein [Beggiatoa leptomitoformis]AUI69122.1 tetratricopeptide repeat protein [Beggiatoa leptomitoformis]QGX03759.1 tetratricopeptide repeat protein [Beggiatoa leptomitoformis]
MNITLITITEKSFINNGFSAELAFNHQRRYQITITPPFDEKQEHNLAWYFEKYLAFPFTDNVRFNETALSIKTYGEQLFKQVFHEPDAYSDYRDALKTGFTLEIIGSPAFHALHWESLHDEKRPAPFALQFEIVRKPLHFNSPYQAITPQVSPTLNVLLVVARPNGRNDVAYRTISRPLVEMVRNSADLHVHFDILRPATFQALTQHLEDVKKKKGAGFYQIVHFDVHGAVLDYTTAQTAETAGRISFDYGRGELQPFEGKKAFIFLNHEQTGKAAPISAESLTDLLFQHGVPVVLLNACQSAKQENTSTETSLASYLMQAGTQAVVGMAYSVTVSAATLFMQTLYEQLFEGASLAVAIQRGRFELDKQKERQVYYNQLIKLEDWLLPVVYQNVPQVQFALRAFSVEEERTFYEQDALRFSEPKTAYGFFGRDLDILEIETAVLKRNSLLIQGMGGAGKTTLLKHLGAWWQTTHFVDKVFYFGYDEKAWTRQQIMRDIAIQLWGKLEYEQRFQAFSEDAQQKKLAKALRSERHLLILDNLESVTGSALAIQHVLTVTERENLQHFLQELVGGASLVLLGSRGAETWLKTGTFEINQFILNGLDSEAASQLVNEILNRHQIKTEYKQQDDFKKLLKLLAGYPLALQVVLQNLTTKTPTDILTALTAGDSAIDLNSTDKTQSILRCIEYSHSNLSPDAQQLLLCLAPFVGVINTNGLAVYTELLKQQPALAHLPFEKWETVLQEAKNWGLLGQHESHIYLTIQPTLPYFLQTQLQNKVEVKTAIETAFRLYYEKMAAGIYQLQKSKDPKQKQLGQLFASIEFENLQQSVQFALTAQVSIFYPYIALSNYFDATQNLQQGLVFGQQVLTQLEQYSPEKLAGQLGAELVGVIDNIANCFLQSQEYALAEQTYQKALKIWKNLTFFEKTERAKLNANTYHQLGMVAQAQRQWSQAQDYYQQALAILIEFNDRYSQASTYNQLGMVVEEQRQWSQAQDYYQQALAIWIEFNDRYAQAGTYHQLGNVAYEQRQWSQAQDYYQQALAILIEFNDRYSQASTYNQLGMVVEEQRQWSQAQDYYQQALAIWIEFNDRYAQAGTYHQLGNVAYEQRQWSQAQDYYQQALAILIEFNDRYSQASTYNQLGRVAEEQRQWVQAQDYYQQALAIWIEFNDRYSQAGTYHQLGRVAEEQRQWSQAEDYYQQALAIWIEFNDRYSQARTYHQLGRVAQEQRQWSQAEDYYQQALAIKIEFNDRYSQAYTYHQLGRVAQEQRQWSQAEDYYQQALAIKIEFNDRYSQASTYHQLGMVAQEQRQWSQAEDYYQQALAIFIEFNDRYSQASTYHQLGMVAQEQRQWSQAQDYYQQALAIKIEFNDRYSQASTYHNLGMVAQEQRQWSQAEDYYQQALAIKIEFNDRYSQASTYHSFGSVAQEQRQWSEAQDYYQQALAIYIEFNDRYSQARTYHSFGSVAQEQRQWSQAQDYYQQALAIYIEFNDSYSQAGTYHQLGRVAEEQRQWSQAKDYYQQALAIWIKFNDSYSQASTYHQLGLLAEAQEDWEQAIEYLLQAYIIFAEYQDEHNLQITLENLARIYQQHPNLVEQKYKALGISMNGNS